MLTHDYVVSGFYVRGPRFIRALRAVRSLLEPALEAAGYLPSLLPSVIPESMLRAEASHIAGFAPLVYWITETGEGIPLEEKLALPISSETAYCWVFKELVGQGLAPPFNYYQERSVFRAEQRSTAALEREREFLWIEAHTAFLTPEEGDIRLEKDRALIAEALDRWDLDWEYVERFGSERCPGAERSFAFDITMGDGRKNQVASLHHLGQKFSSIFGLTAAGGWLHQTSTGIGLSRLVWALEDRGLIDESGSLVTRAAATRAAIV